MPVVLSKSNISTAELNQRVAVIKRFKELLKAQRDRFHEYLSVLDRQKEIIQTGSSEELIQHVELEEKIVSDIFSIQKVIDPLEQMYQSTRAFKLEKTIEKAAGEEVFSLKEALDGLKAEAVLRIGQNKELLTKRMVELRSEIQSLKSKSYIRRPFNNGPNPSMVDIQG